MCSLCSGHKPRNTQASSSIQMTASQHQTQLKQKFIVCDTNVWIISLPVIIAILHDPKTVNYIIYVPYRVGEELDYKKKDPCLETSANARKAIRLRNDLLKAYPSRVIQQTNQENRNAVIKHYYNRTKLIPSSCISVRSVTL